MSADNCIRSWTAIPLALALAAAFYSLLSSGFSGAGDGGRPLQGSLVAVSGLWVIIPAMIPVFLTLIPFVLPMSTVRITITALLFLFCFIAGFSIGFYYLPAALAELAATCVVSSRVARDHGLIR